MKYLQRSFANDKHLYYQRPWPKELLTVAKQHGYGTIYLTKLAVKPDSPDVDRAIAKSAADKKYLQIVGRLASIPAVGTGSSGNLQTRQRKKTRVTIQPTTPPISSVLTLFHASLKPESEKAIRERQKYRNEFAAQMAGDRYATNAAIHDIHRGLELYPDAMLKRGCTSATVARGRNSATSVLNWAMREHRLDSAPRLQQLPKHKAKTKKPLSHAEQEELVAILRADGEETRVRNRVIPVVLAVELIKTKLSAASERAAKAADNAATVNQSLKGKIHGR